MNVAVLASLAAAIFIGLASYMVGLVQPILLLGFACMCAWVTHDTTIDPTIRMWVQFLGLFIGAVAFVWVFIHSLTQGAF